MIPNIRQNCKSPGIFQLQNSKQQAYGFLTIHNGEISISLIGHVFVNPKSHEVFQTSKNICIIGLLNNGYNIITYNFETTNVDIQTGNVPYCLYHIFSISFFGLKCKSPEIEDCDQIRINMDDLSHYLYTSELTKENDYKKHLCDIKFNEIKYNISSILTISSLNDLSKFRKLEQRWINFSITSNDDDWNKYKNIIPLAKDMKKFIELMTRINVDITNLIESHNIKNGVQQSIYIAQSSISRHINYTRMHQLSYIRLNNIFSEVFSTFLNKMMNNNRFKSLVNAILLVRRFYN